MQKQMKKNDLFLIGEVSKLFHISISILRYYDKIGLLQPEYTDEKTGYRYYSTRQFECLNTIRYLRALNMPLDGIMEFLQNRNTDNIKTLLLKQKQEVEKQEKELRKIKEKISHRLEQINDALSSKVDEIELIHKPERRIAAVKKNLAPKSYLDLEASIRLLEAGEETSVTFLGKVGIGISREKLLEKEFTTYDLVFIILDEEDSFNGETIIIPPETCVRIRFRGGHEQAVEYYEKLFKYIADCNYKISGFSKEITMIDYGLTNNTEQFVTEVQIPVEIEMENYDDREDIGIE